MCLAHVKLISTLVNNCEGVRKVVSEILHNSQFVGNSLYKHQQMIKSVFCIYVFPYVILLAFDYTDLYSGNNSQLKEILKSLSVTVCKLLNLISLQMKKVLPSSFQIVTSH